MAVVVVLDPIGIQHIHDLAGDVVHHLTDQVESDANRYVPVDTGELRASIHAIKLIDEGQVWVGTDHWAPTEYGSKPHLISAHGDYALANRETGFYAPRRVQPVHHPGTPEQSFMRIALYQKRDITTGL